MPSGTTTTLPPWGTKKIASTYQPDADVVIVHGDSLTTLRRLPDGFAKLIITSPPYNLGKAYEKATALDEYLETLSPVLDELVRVLSPQGSLCWQVGNYVERSEVYPLDIFYYPIFKRLGLKLRNRIVWHFAHGLHPSKYPGKTHFKGEKYGQPSGNPLGKNPSDVWKIVARDWESALWDIPNVKANHPEKTIHPCQFPIELVERCVLALTDVGDWVLDPFSGVGSALIAALAHGRHALGCEKEADYVKIAHERIADFNAGTLKYRKLGTPVFQPTGREKVSQVPLAWRTAKPSA